MLAICRVLSRQTAWGRKEGERGEEEGGKGGREGGEWRGRRERMRRREGGREKVPTE